MPTAPNKRKRKLLTILLDPGELSRVSDRLTLVSAAEPGRLLSALVWQLPGGPWQVTAWLIPWRIWQVSVWL